MCDYFLYQEVAWFFFVPRGCVIFFVPRGCVIFFVPRQSLDSNLRVKKELFIASEFVVLFRLSVRDAQATPPWILQYIYIYTMGWTENYWSKTISFNRKTKRIAANTFKRWPTWLDDKKYFHFCSFKPYKFWMTKSLKKVLKKVLKKLKSIKKVLKKVNLLKKVLKKLKSLKRVLKKVKYKRNLTIKHRKNCKTLPREHFIVCQGVKIFLLKRPF